MSETDGTVSPEEVRHVADLARVGIDEEELDRFADQLSNVLAYFEALDDVPEVDAEPELTNVLRADEERECLEPEAALGNAPEHEDGYFKGPRVS